MVLRAAHPVCRSDRSEFLAAVVAALEGCDEVTNDALGRVLAENSVVIPGRSGGGSTEPNRWPSVGLPGGASMLNEEIFWTAGTQTLAQALRF
jgi:hypothetical protein